MTELASRERAVLDLLRARYESRGDSFFAHPIGDLVPPFLGDYRPDAIVKSGIGGSVIEVKHAPPEGLAGHLAAIAERFKGHPEWRFIVVDPSEFPELNQRFPVGSGRTVADAIAEARTLASAGHLRAAFFMEWSILEALARARLAGLLRDPTRPFAPTALAELLEQYGLITAAQGRKLRSLVPMRNSVVHGDFDYEVNPAALNELQRIVQSVQDADALPAA